MRGTETKFTSPMLQLITQFQTMNFLKILDIDTDIFFHGEKTKMYQIKNEAFIARILLKVGQK